MTLVLHPFYPIQDITEFATGAVIIIVASVVIHRIYNKSKNLFAYTLMTLAVTLGVS
jgi:hypothetical protein